MNSMDIGIPCKKQLRPIFKEHALYVASRKINNSVAIVFSIPGFKSVVRLFKIKNPDLGNTLDPRKGLGESSVLFDWGNI